MGARRLIKSLPGFALWLFVAPGAMLLGLQAKSEPKSPVKPGVVSGRVFLITVGGDVKPARMAKVYLLYMHRGVKFAGADKEYHDSAELQWMNALIKAMQDDRKAEEQKSASTDYHYNEAALCQGKLAEYSRALSETFDWVSAKKKEWQIVIGQADEEGNFRISVPHPGDYSLVIDGHAGFNDAVWETHPITVSPGTETTIKMSPPEVACVQTGD